MIRFDFDHRYGNNVILVTSIMECHYNTIEFLTKTSDQCFTLIVDELYALYFHTGYIISDSKTFGLTSIKHQSDTKGVGSMSNRRRPKGFRYLIINGLHYWLVGCWFLISFDVMMWSCHSGLLYIAILMLSLTLDLSVFCHAVLFKYDISIDCWSSSIILIFFSIFMEMYVSLWDLYQVLSPLL